MRARRWVILGLLLLGVARLATRSFRREAGSSASTVRLLVPDSYSPRIAPAPANGPSPLAAVATPPDAEAGIGNTGFWLWLGYPLAILAAESAIVQNPQQGIQIHLVLLATLLSHAWLTDSIERSLLLALTIVPLARLASIAATLATTSEDYRWYLISFLPILLSALAVARSVGLSRSDLGLRPGVFPVQLAIGLVGIPIGVVEYAILDPAPLASALSWQEVWLPATTLVVCVGFIQEFAFRGVLQGSAIAVLGRRGLVYAAVLFAMLRVGQAPVLDAVFMFFAGLLLAWIVSATRSLLGVSIAHGLAGVLIYIVLPIVGWQIPAALLPVAVSIQADPRNGADVQPTPPQPSDTRPDSGLPAFPAVAPEFPPTPPPASTPPADDKAEVLTTPTAQPALALATPTAEPPPVPASTPPGPEEVTDPGGRVSAEQAPPPPVRGFDTEEYVVRPGDTLFRIAVKHGATLDLLKSLNPGGHDSIVIPGQSVVVPVGFPRKWVSYVIQPGDTLASLAAARRTTEDALVDVNNLPDWGETLEPGQKILVPPAAR